MKWIILFLLLALSQTTSAANEDFLSKFWDEKKLIGCINTVTLEIVSPTKKGNCYYGKDWQNILIPSRSEALVFLDVFGSEAEAINRFPVVNFESGFDQFAKNAIAKGYVQTKKEYNVPIDPYSQLTWMKKRMDTQKGTSCRWYVESGEERMLRCLYARHYGALSGFHWYPNKAIATRSFYLDYFYD